MLNNDKKPVPANQGTSDEVTEAVEQVAEEVTEAVEQVAEEVEPQATNETSVEAGVSAILARLDNIEASISGLLKPKPIMEGEPKDNEQSNPNPETQTRQAAQRGGRRVNIFRKRKQ